MCCVDIEAHCGRGKRNRTPTLTLGWKRCMCMCFVFSKGYNLHNSRHHHQKKKVLLLCTSLSCTWRLIKKVFNTTCCVMKGYWKFSVSMEAFICTWRTTQPHTHTRTRTHHTYWVCRMICLLMFPLLWFLFQALNQRGRSLVVGGRGGGVIRRREGKGPHFRGTAVWWWRSAQG